MRTVFTQQLAVTLCLTLGLFAGLAPALPASATPAASLAALCDTHGDLSPIVITDTGEVIPDPTTALCHDMEEGLEPLAATAGTAAAADSGSATGALEAFLPPESVATEYHSHGFLNAERQIIAATGIALPVGENGDTYWSPVRWHGAQGPVASLEAGTAALAAGEYLLGYFEETGELIAVRALADTRGGADAPRFAVQSVLARSSCQAGVACLVSILKSQTIFCKLSGPCPYLCVRIADVVGGIDPERVVAQAGCGVAVSLIRSLLSGGLLPVLTAIATSFAGCFGCANNLFNRNPNLRLACSSLDRVTEALDKGLCK
jgi:hypothetical protein